MTSAASRLGSRALRMSVARPPRAGRLLLSTVTDENRKISGKPLERGFDEANAVTGAPKTSEASKRDGIGEEMRADTFVVEDNEVKKGYNSSGWMDATKNAVRGVVDKVKQVTGNLK